MAAEQASARYRHLYAMLLRLYPSQYREHFADSMEQTFNDLCRERTETSRWLLGFVLWAFVETSIAVIKENAMNPSPPNSLMTKPSAWLPPALSLACLAFLICYVALFGPDRTPSGQRPDEGTAAHVFQLLMLAQALIAVFFAIRWLPRRPKSAALVLSVQVAIAAIPVLVVWLIERGA